MSTDKSDKDISYKSNDIYISDSDDETLVSDHDTMVDTKGSDILVNVIVTQIRLCVKPRLKVGENMTLLL